MGRVDVLIVEMLRELVKRNLISIEILRQMAKKGKINPNFELAHIIGLNITNSKSLQCHPCMQESVIYSVGGIIISEDLMEKNNQIFFRHGNNKINCFSIYSHIKKCVSSRF